MGYKPNHIVLTTIDNATVLNDYYANLLINDELESAKVWIIGDKKTPSDIYNLAKELTNNGLETVYLDIEYQDNWGRRYPDFYNLVPYNDDCRRNIGYLHALECGCERLISIDSDNYPTNDDFVNYHSQTGKNINRFLLSDTSGFYNICELLNFKPSRHIFPRGYPFSLRDTDCDIYSSSRQVFVKIGVTAGLWLSDPDIDSITWLNGKVKSVSYFGFDLSILSQNTWTPINSQNTSIARELIPAFAFVPMGWIVPGGRIGRYGDILAGYFLQAIIQGTDYHVAFGRPLVEHRRNSHNYLKDLYQEYWGMLISDYLVMLLREDFVPKEESICNRVIELSEFLASKAIEKLPSWSTPEIKGFMMNTSKSLKLWANVCNDIIS